MVAVTAEAEAETEAAGAGRCGRSDRHKVLRNVGEEPSWTRDTEDVTPLAAGKGVGESAAGRRLELLPADETRAEARERVAGRAATGGVGGGARRRQRGEGEGGGLGVRAGGGGACAAVRLGSLRGDVGAARWW
jgi:hypothetical protein